MNAQLFTPRQLVVLKTEERRHIRAGAGVVFVGGLTGLQAALLICVTGLEYSLFYEVFDYLKGPLPGEEAQWSVALLALTGTVMFLAFHLHAKESPHSGAVRFIRQSVNLLLPLYAIAAGGAVAAIIYFDGAEGMFTSVMDSGRDLFSEPTAPTSIPLLDTLVSLLPVAFSVACGGLAVINLFVAHRLVSLISQNVGEIRQRGSAAKEAFEAMRVIKTSQRRFAELQNESAALVAVNHRAEEVAIANRILGVVSSELRPYEVWIADQRLRGDDASIPFVTPDASFDVDEMKRRVGVLRATTRKTVLSAMRSEQGKE